MVTTRSSSGLAEGFERADVELGQFVEEEHAVVGEADLAGARLAAAADEAGVGDGVVRGAEGPLADEADALGQHAAHAVYGGHTEGFGAREGGHDAGHGAGEQGLAGARRPGHEEVVPAGGGDLEGALDVLLAAHVAEVDGGRADVAPGVAAGVVGGGRRGQRGVAARGLHQGREGGEAEHLDAVDQGGLGGIGLGHDEATGVAVAQGGGDGQHAGHVAQVAVEGKFADEHRAAGELIGDLARGDEDADGDGGGRSRCPPCAGRRGRG